MYYTVYKITNLINNKFYIGKHQTKNLNDEYFGSGKYLRRAIRKHGQENFKKEILEVFDVEWKMNLAEKILVVTDIEVSYNLCSGGQGGFGYINKNDLGNQQEHGRLGGVYTVKNKLGWFSPEAMKRSHSFECQRKKSLGNTNWLGRKHSEETKIKMATTAKGRIPSNKGKPHSDETKEKIRLSLIKYQLEKRNISC